MGVDRSDLETLNMGTDRRVLETFDVQPSSLTSTDRPGLEAHAVRPSCLLSLGQSGLETPDVRSTSHESLTSKPMSRHCSLHELEWYARVALELVKLLVSIWKAWLRILDCKTFLPAIGFLYAQRAPFATLDS